jgi:hypothetical protein
MAWSVPQFLDAIKVQLDAVAALDDVTVFTAEPGNELTAESIVFHTVRGTADPGAMGPSNTEDYACEGYIHIEKPGGGESVWKAARDRADAILTEIDTQLTTDPRVSNTVGYARLGRFDFMQAYGEVDGVPTRWAQIQFQIDIKAL